MRTSKKETVEKKTPQRNRQKSSPEKRRRRVEIRKKEREADVAALKKLDKKAAQKRDKTARLRYLKRVYCIARKWHRSGNAKFLMAKLDRTYSFPTYDDVVDALLFQTASGDRRARHKYSATLKWAYSCKIKIRDLIESVKHEGGINECVAARRRKCGTLPSPAAKVSVRRGRRRLLRRRASPRRR